MPTADDERNGDGAEAGPRESERRAADGAMEDWLTALREMAPYLDLGWRLAGTTVGPPLLGHFLIDVWLGTTPWALLGGCLVGFAGAVLLLRRLQEEFDS
jgi:hypothetical protein